MGKFRNMEMIFIFLVVISLLLLLCYQNYVNTFEIMETNFIHLRHNGKIASVHDLKRIELKKYYQHEIKVNNTATVSKTEEESEENETKIQNLQKELDVAKSKLKEYKEKDVIIHDLVKELYQTKYKLSQMERHENKNLASTTTSNSTLSLNVTKSNHDSMCERRFGISLIENWKKSEQVWCSNDDVHGHNNMKSELKCFPYRQEHKAPESFPDMFCVATNFFVNFAGIYGGNDPPPLNKNPPGLQYYAFGAGSMFSTCNKTDKWYSPYFMPHTSNQVTYRIFNSKNAQLLLLLLFVVRCQAFSLTNLYPRKVAMK